MEEETLRRELSRRYPEKDEQTLAAAISRSGGFLGQAMEFLSEDSLQSAQTEQFIRGYGEKNSLLLTTTLVSMERWKRDQLVQELQQWLRILGNAQLCRNGMAAAAPGARELAAARSGRELYTAIETIDKAIDYALKNVSPAAICGWLVWALR